ncbi:MFS transporter [Cohnella sp. AR92]|uniref:MFS transporter n=1 Tax=Cohnella sp. AR92 TaxID=648716 RepID=UPI000F8D2077|nr:MFS transporter [Cohnella sp. AR92]RUS48916.1 DHA2 family efflux MFS transporter permease subunit [Cohnella sp. AR92]
MNPSSLSEAYATKPATNALLLIGLSLGYFIVLLDMTVLNVALPAIRLDLGGGFAGMQWASNAYTIVYACLLLAAGSLADRFGAKRLFIWGLALFLAASVLSAAASSLAVLIVARAWLGVGGAALLPASMALFTHAYPNPAARARALGIWASLSGIAMAAGPVIGGVLVDSFGWRSIFLMNVPIALASIAVAAAGTRETPRRSETSFDIGGQLTAIVAVGSLTFGLVQGGSVGWSAPQVVVTLIVAAVAAVLFVLFEALGKSPMLPLHLFRISNFSTGLAAGLAVNFAFSGLLFLLSLYFQQTLGYSAFAAGLAFLPFMLPPTFNPILTGRLVGRIGPRIPAAIGFALLTAGTLVLLLARENSSYAIPLIGQLLAGFGVSFAIPSLIPAVVSSVPKEQAGIASGALNSSRQLGAVLGVALLGTIASSSDSFIAGLHAALVVASILLLAGGILSLLRLGRSGR